MSVATLTPAPSKKFSKNSIVAFYQSSIGKKTIVGVTGLIWVAYVLGHLAGNLVVTGLFVLCFVVYHILNFTLET